MKMFSKYLKAKRQEEFLSDKFERIKEYDLRTKNKELYSQINFETMRISTYFEKSIRKFPSLFECNLKTFEDSLTHLKKISIPNKCVCAKSIDKIPGWRCVDCSKYENSLYCNDCYINSKDLHKGHKILYLNNSGGMCDCGDPDSLYTYCHEHSGPFIEQKQIEEYINKSFEQKVLENLRKFFDEFFLEFSKYLILTSKCELFMEELFDEKFSGDLNGDLIKEKNDVNSLKSNFCIVFQNLIYFLRLITKNNLAMLHLITSYFLKNNLESIKPEKEYITDHRCIELNQQEIKIYYDTIKKEEHICKCPFFRHFLTNYRDKVQLNSEGDEKEFLFSFVHNLSARYAFCILYFFLYNQNLYNNNKILTYCRTQFYLEDTIELIAKKTSFLEDSVDLLYKYLSKLMKNCIRDEKLKTLKNEVMIKIVRIIHQLKEDITYLSKPKIKILMTEKVSYFKKIVDIICLFHNIYEYKSIVPHPVFQDKSPSQFLFTLENYLTKIPGLLTCCFDWEKIDEIKEIYKYIINKILNQEKEGINQLKNEEFSFYLLLYRIFGNFMNAFCFNYSFINNCNIIKSINFFKNNFFESQEQIEIFVDIILKDYFKLFGFIYGAKNNFFNYYDRVSAYFAIYTGYSLYQYDFSLLKYLFVLTEKEISINTFLKFSNVENVFTKFDQIFNLGIIADNNKNLGINKEKDEKAKQSPLINEDNIPNLDNLSDEEKRLFILKLALNERMKSSSNQEDFNIIMQWESLIEFLIIFLKDDSSCYYSLINTYNDINSSKTKFDLFNDIKNNEYAMYDLKNILQEKMIHNLLSHGNLIDMQTFEKNMNEYLSILFEEDNIYNITLEELTINKMNGETKMFYLKDEYLKLFDCNYFINPKDKSSAQKYILDFKKDIIKTYNYHFYNTSELLFNFFEKVYEKVLLSKNNLELIIKIIEKLFNDDKISEILDKTSIRNSLLPVILNYLQMFNVINTKSFIEFKIENKLIINKLYELLANFVKNNENNLDKDLEEFVKEILNQINSYQLIFDSCDGDLSKLNKYDYNTRFVEQLMKNKKTNMNNINIVPGNIDNFKEKKQKVKNIKEKLKSLMTKKSNNFMKKIESSEEIIKAIDEHINDIENKKNIDDEIMCFYCRNPIKLNSFDKPYGKLGFSTKDLFYVNSVIATLRDELSILELKNDKNKIYEQAKKMIYRQGYFRLISCGHYFHMSCFLEGCKKSNNTGYNCPLCLKYQNILIPPLTLFHDKYSFLQSENIKELFKEGNNKVMLNEKDDNKKIKEGINLFNASVVNFLMAIGIFKNGIKNYNKFLDNIYPYYKAFINYFENIFYINGTTFHKQQQIDNIKNLILSIRLVIHDSINKNEIIKFIKETLFELASGPDEKVYIYRYYDSYMHYINLFEKIILSLEIIFDYEEIKETLKYILYIFLPYFCFGLYFKNLMIKKNNNDINEEQFIHNLSLEEFNKYLKENNKQIMTYLNSFLKKFCFIKLISDHQDKNEEIINTFNELSVKNILSLLDMNDLVKLLSQKEILINEIINLLPKAFNSNEIFYELFHSILNFDKVINSILENIKKYITKVNYEINHGLLIQFSPIKFNFINLDYNIFDFIESNIGKPCQVCKEIPKKSFLCLICGEKVCKPESNIHTRKCTNNYCIFIDMDSMRLIYLDEKDEIIKFSPIYVNKTGSGPISSEISNEFNLCHEKLNLMIKNYVSKDFYK